MLRKIGIEIPLKKGNPTKELGQQSSKQIDIGENLNRKKSKKKSLQLTESMTLHESVYALAFGAHPDDVEISCGAILHKIIREGKTVAVCDLTEGEMGTRGTVEKRYIESAEASKIIGYKTRLNLNLGDATFEVNTENREKLVKMIRHFRPHIVFAPQVRERHPDHERAAGLIKDACFYAGLKKIETVFQGQPQARHRPQYLFHYLQDHFEIPHLIVDISEEFEVGMNAILAFESQFYSPLSHEPETFISRKSFLESLEARAKTLGEVIGVKYGQGLLYGKPLGISHFSRVF
ncbi:MAG: bacillithiol biosynthesis deacetylase BshB1 [Chloroherpetonaceae bacterium]|nr:bacillithiol biosynthesis deacetylase BshB1 [Chloroherpetonaceae bacterium]